MLVGKWQVVLFERCVGGMIVALLADGAFKYLPPLHYLYLALAGVGSGGMY